MSEKNKQSFFKRNARLLVFVVAIAAMLGIGWWLEAPRHLQTALTWVDGLGFWGPVVYVGLYIAICVFMIPGSILTLGAGAVFGVLRGFVYTSIASTIGATVAFVLGRFFLRDWVQKKAATNPRIAAIDDAVGKEGAKVIFLLRLSPLVPFSISNYVYGLTKVKLPSYVLASWLGMIPGTLLYVYIGSLARRFAELGAAQHTTSTAEWALYVVGLLATVLATIRVTIVARRALSRSMKLDDVAADEPTGTT